MSHKPYLSHDSVFFGWVRIFLNDFSTKLAFFWLNLNKFILSNDNKFVFVHLYACVFVWVCVCVLVYIYICVCACVLLLKRIILFLKENNFVHWKYTYTTSTTTNKAKEIKHRVDFKNATTSRTQKKRKNELIQNKPTEIEIDVLKEKKKKK